MHLSLEYYLTGNSYCSKTDKTVDDGFMINIDGSGENRLAENSYAQGLASWSRLKDSLIYFISAIYGKGKYDVYMMNSDSTENRNITRQYFPLWSKG